MEGERALLDFLDAHLSDGWSIYVQPYVNDMRPDIVVANPKVGIVVYEVKDWTVGLYRFEGGKLIRQTETERRTEDNPLLKARWYAESLYEQFLGTDEAELEIGFRPNNRALCRHGIYFHKANSSDVRDLFKDFLRDDDIVLGSDSLRVEMLGNIVPYHYLKQSQFVRERQFEALSKAHEWLLPPRHSIEQQRPLPELSGDQREYAKPGVGFHRIRGVAGAGKSFVLAHRAAKANADGRSILVLSFNITMSHVLHDLLKRARYPLNWQEITWGHFHGWARNQAVQSGLLSIEPATLRRGQQSLSLSISELTGGQATENGNAEDDIAVLLACLDQLASNDDLAESYEKPMFSGIYVDEAQDFKSEWLDTLAQFLAPGGELVIFGDHRQNLYGTDGGRDQRAAMAHCRFRGPWAQLPRKSRRLPWRIAMFLNEFALSIRVGDSEDSAIEDYTEHLPQPDLATDVLAWCPVADTEIALDAIPRALAELGSPNPNDVVILVTTHQYGLVAVERLLSRYHQIVHVFGATKQESRQRKAAFWMGRGGLKMCTIHSFKGWEIENVIIVWPSARELEQIPPLQRVALFYTALSRGMRNVVVINANREYDQFFRDWDLIGLQEPTAGGQII